jgi:dihydrofolate reductase
LNALSNIVFSDTLGDAPWGDFEAARVVKGSAAKEVARLKEQPGKDMVIWGSLTLARSLMEEGLIDDYQLVICPVILGRGKPLFRDNADTLDMALVNTKWFDKGTVLLEYAPAGATAAAGKR